MKNETKSRKKKLMKSASLRLPRSYPWKILGKLAEDLSQFLDIDERMLLEQITRDRDLTAYTLLSDIWGLQCMTSEGTAPVCNLRAKYLLASLLKKFQFDADSTERRNAAVRSFITAELNCRSYNRYGWRDLAWSEDQSTINAFTYARSWIQKVIGVELPEFDVLTKRSRHGPGASSNTRNGNTSSYFKYKEWPYDCTASARRNAILAIESDERWLGALEDSYRKRYNIPKHLILNRGRFWDSVLNIVDGNKISFVPKSFKTDRTIAIEPTLNLYLQLGVDGFIRSRLKRWSIDLDHQTKNRVLSRRGSIADGDNSLVTLDLSMASDSISLKLCRQLLPLEWYDYLMKLRSPYGDLDGRSIRYEKISSMGNGYTFALESLVFAALVYGVAKHRQGTVDMSQIAIFGDDLIVPKAIVCDVIQILKKAGFQLNEDKSFLSGPCRESCGADWFKGKPMRPIFLKKYPEHVKELYNDFNRLQRILDLRFGITKSKTNELIMKWIPSKFKTLKGPISDEEFDTYIHTRKTGGHLYRHGYWRFKRLIRRPKLLHGKPINDFMFRKLMSSLSPSPPTNQWWGDRDIGGRTFEIPDRKNWYFAYTKSASSDWKFDYAESVDC